jgi:hypothetical protein
MMESLVEDAIWIALFIDTCDVSPNPFLFSVMVNTAGSRAKHNTVVHGALRTTAALANDSRRDFTGWPSETINILSATRDVSYRFYGVPYILPIRH